MVGNELFYKILHKPEEVTWVDFFSDFYKKHSKSDMDLVISAGSPQDSKNRTYLLQAWQKPWLFYQMLKYGLICCGMIYIVLYMLVEMSGSLCIPAINLFAIITLPLLFPIVVMIFFWELNVPRNISLLQLIGIFLTGGFLSLVTAMFLFNNISIADSSFAPFIEEPAKLIISVGLLCLLNKKPEFKIFGLTGLAVGAAVGAGFGGFESVQYGIKTSDGMFHVEFLAYMDKDILIFLFQNQLLRGIWAVAGHTLFCAPYTAAVALHTENGKITSKSFWNKDFGIAFGISFVCHFIWNSISVIPVFVIITIVLWLSSLSIVKKSFIQFLKAENGAQGGYYSLQGITGPLLGRELPIGSTALIGRKTECDICLPDRTPGVSGIHCRLVYDRSQLFITDAGSTYGTYVNNVRIEPKVYQKLKNGDRISLGSNEVSFRVCQK